MKSVISISLSRLRNAEYYLLNQSVLSRFQPSLIQELKFETLIENLKEPFERFATTFKSNQSSSYTPEIQQADRERDAYFLGIKDLVKGFQRLGSEEEKQAAAVLNYVIRPYANAPRTSMNENTAKLKAFIYDMCLPQNQPSVDVLKLSGKISGLEDWNDTFEDLLHARLEKRVSSEEVGKLVALRREIDPAYRAVIDRLNALYMIAYQDEDEGKESQLAELIAILNVDIRLIEDTVHRRLARRKNAKEEIESEVGEDIEENEEE